MLVAICKRVLLLGLDSRKIISTFLRQLSTELETAVTQKCEKKISVNIHLVITISKRDTHNGKQYSLFVSV